MTDILFHQIVQFSSIGEVFGLQRLPGGHINDSYLVEASTGKYLLQRVNRAVFKNMIQLMSNMVLVSDHINGKRQILNSGLQVPDLIRTNSGDYFYTDEEGEYWRMYRFIEGYTFDVVKDPLIAWEGARAVGLFHALLSDLNVSSLHYSIHRFHDMDYRMDAFQKALSYDRLRRSMKCHNEISKLMSVASDVYFLHEQVKKGMFPMRVTHNDTKFNNILFDSSQKAIALIDLDTVMPGYLVYDFGDAIRTVANTSVEDEVDLSAIDLDMDIFSAYVRGYFRNAHAFITSHEKNFLPLSVKYMTFIMALRFLTDYLEGDVYYKIKHEHHNLQRVRTQIKLIESIDKHFSRMQEIVFLEL